MIRRVMPSVLANHLVNTQPMRSGGSIFDRNRDYYTQDFIGVKKMKKKHYQHFILVPNRRKHQKFLDLENVFGYTRIRTDIKKITSTMSWCRKNLKDGAWVNFGPDFVFAYNKDATWFALAVI